MSKNKMGKYFKYAIGEILLVVIGILIALQINNWNDNKKQAKELNEYLAKISNNISLDIQNLNDLKTRRLQVVNNCKAAVADFQTNNFDLLTNIKAADVFVDFYFTPNQSGYDALKNSNYLGKLNGTKVDSLLDAYNTALYKTVKEEESYLEYVENMEVLWTAKYDASELIAVYINQATIEFDDLEESIQTKLKNTFSDHVFRSTVTRGAFQISTLSYYDELIDIGLSTIKAIENHKND